MELFVWTVGKKKSKSPVALQQVAKRGYTHTKRLSWNRKPELFHSFPSPKQSDTGDLFPNSTF